MTHDNQSKIIGILEQLKDLPLEMRTRILGNVHTLPGELDDLIETQRDYDEIENLTEKIQELGLRLNKLLEDGNCDYRVVEYFDDEVESDDD